MIIWCSFDISSSWPCHVTVIRPLSPEWKVPDSGVFFHPLCNRDCSRGDPGVSWSARPTDLVRCLSWVVSDISQSYTWSQTNTSSVRRLCRTGHSSRHRKMEPSSRWWWRSTAEWFPMTSDYHKSWQEQRWRQPFRSFTITWLIPGEVCHVLYSSFSLWWSKCSRDKMTVFPKLTVSRCPLT